MRELLDTLGIEISAIIAGLVGSVAALSIMPPRTFLQAVTTLIGGVGCAAYGTPVAVAAFDHYFDTITRNLENGMAFAMGVVGMNIVAGILKLSVQWKNRPTLDPRNIGKRNDD